MADDIESPCVRVCIIDGTRDICRGCYRTLGEISKWSSYTLAQKLAVLEDLAQRKARTPFPHHT